MRLVYFCNNALYTSPFFRQTLANKTLLMNSDLAYSFLVPIDFTETSIHALHYAADIVKKHDGIIHLLHVVDDRTEPSEETMAAVRAKVTGFAREQQEKLNTTIIPNTVSGNIFNSIGETAKKLGAQLIVMGIHGMQGIQFIIGSFAARVILGSPVPVLLTNGSMQFKGFNNIVLPFDINIRMDELLNKTIEMGLLFNSTIHLFYKNEKLPFWRKRKANRTIKRTLNQIQKTGLNCQNVVLEAKDENITDSILQYAENIKADLIMVTTQNQHNSKEYVIVETGIRLMENSRTPLYFLNPESHF